VNEERWNAIFTVEIAALIPYLEVLGGQMHIFSVFCQYAVSFDGTGVLSGSGG
jgi:hypothetical protein